MPGMSGKELKKKVEVIRPGIKVLFMSGYTSNVIAHRGVLEKGVHFIQKPFSMKDLARKVREVIGEQ
jgi:two-component system cell cycle sensor histidine kinase/response regulator CckA